MRVRKYGVALAVVAAASMAMSGCSAKKESTVDGKKTLVVGVKSDQPGLGLRSGSGFEGFDVDVANYIAKKLGAKKVEFKEARSANRETFLQNGTVDMVVATYSITAARLPKVTFGGPYIVTHQDIMVRANDTSIKSLGDLKGKKLCAVQGSNSWKNITDGTNKQNLKVDAKTVPVQGYEECVTKLKSGSVDAVSTDATILAGYAGRDAGSFKVVNAPFTDEKYGVGLKKGDKKGCEAVNNAISDAYKDGSMKQYWDKWFGKSGLPFDATVPAAQGCS
ncbi:glutamate ABC transporter substrate-binding protein [Actinomadura rupiterrae]|uniref:glutamate ABC transporter substrate-binding protein n=1 Tax=Actinomadura rupiterrae TaxID=559627 RepID=UPI0020A5B500|nr:glutamate ABC transporter substrate-binding protein [Actinomadura rupiterrae]MCP2338831.1 glutamate transport system substrate-binding protein [Actinomadura rupiterrae]